MICVGIRRYQFAPIALKLDYYLSWFLVFVWITCWNVIFVDDDDGDVDYGDNDDDKLFSRVKIPCFRAKGHLVYHCWLIKDSKDDGDGEEDYDRDRKIFLTRVKRYPFFKLHLIFL